MGPMGQVRQGFSASGVARSRDRSHLAVESAVSAKNSGQNSMGLYVHIPFCQTKCGYCDFYSVARHDRPTAPLVAALVRELEIRLADRRQPITTVFVGGGTPTLLPPAELSAILGPIRRAAPEDGVREWTVEANPGTVNRDILAVLSETGVDRVSMGAQSFHEDELATLERIHSPDDIPAAVELCRKSGIRRLNLDLIFGIPGQTLASWGQSLRRAIDLGVDHLSCYGLTYEPGTALTAVRDAGRMTPCDEDLEAEMYMLALDFLREAGLEQYEISNFARREQRCLHNLTYWSNEPYIGVGPSAAGYIDGTRYKNVTSIDGYIRAVERDGHAVVERERLEGAALAAETAMLQLRLNEGIRHDAFARHTGFEALEIFARSIDQHRTAGLLEVDDEGMRLTRAGRLVADNVIADFIAEADQRPKSRLKEMRLKESRLKELRLNVLQTVPG